MSSLTPPTRCYLYAKISGGLGNQLGFIAALFNVKYKVFIHGEGLEVENVFLSTDKTDRPTHWDNFFKDCPEILKCVYDQLPEGKWEEVDKNLVPYTYHGDHIEIVINNIKRGISTYINNVLANSKYMPSPNFMMRLLNLREKQENLKVKLKSFQSEKSCAIHFRLGDTKYHAPLFTLLKDSYYINALRFFDTEIQTIYIINELEDQAEVERRVSQFGIPSKVNVLYASQIPEMKEDWESLVLISMCQYNIIANSTFSWWGAFLNTSPEFKVCYPHVTKTPWFGITEYCRIFDLCERDGWTAIES